MSWVVGLQCVPGVLVQGFSRLGGRARGFFDFLAFFGGDTICLLSSRLRPDPDKSYRTASLRHLLQTWLPFSPRDTSRASPSVLETKTSCNSWSASVVTPKTWSFFSACYITCSSTAYTTPATSLAKYDQLLQLAPRFCPNRSGIKTLRIHQPGTLPRIGFSPRRTLIP